MRRTLRPPACDNGPALPVLASPGAGAGLSGLRERSSPWAATPCMARTSRPACVRQSGMAEFAGSRIRAPTAASFVLGSSACVGSTRSGRATTTSDDVLIGIRVPRAIHNPANGADIAVAPSIDRHRADVRRHPPHAGPTSSWGTWPSGRSSMKPFGISLASRRPRPRLRRRRAGRSDGPRLSALGYGRLPGPRRRGPIVRPHGPPAWTAPAPGRSRARPHPWLRLRARRRALVARDLEAVPTAGRHGALPLRCACSYATCRRRAPDQLQRPGRSLMQSRAGAGAPYPSR